MFGSVGKATVTVDGKPVSVAIGDWKLTPLPPKIESAMLSDLEALIRELKPHFNVFFDDKGAVGRRYRRQDEAGTPFCLTIDGDTLKDDTVTIRDRDTLKQDRIPMSQARVAIEKALTPGC